MVDLTSKSPINSNRTIGDVTWSALERLRG